MGWKTQNFRDCVEFPDCFFPDESNLLANQDVEDKPFVYDESNKGL